MAKFYFLCSLMAVLLLGELSAQDARFSQFYANPQFTNPALTGVMEGQMRFNANYRELYTSVLGNNGFKTIAAGLDFRRPVGKGNFFGIGINLMRDEVGESNFTRNQALVSGSYQKQLGGSRRGRGPAHFLVAGGQLGFGQRGFDVEKLWFSRQFFVDPTSRAAYVDQGLSSGEAFLASSSGLYLDFNAGLLWYAVFDENTSFYAGASAAHLNEPNISPREEVDILPRRYSVQLGGEFPLGSSGFSVLPALIAQSQGPLFSGMAGANIRYTQREWREVALRAGAWVHVSNRLDQTSTDAIIISSILEMDRWQLGLSYDLSTGDITDSNFGRGAFEVSMIYTQPANYRSRVVCPKF
ncbi:MAG: PorP/SprF family type IX secretion system membrane protein [Bacteroidota bacterium]